MNTPPSYASNWILTTGATGTVGPALVHELLSRGHRVLCLVRAATPAAARERLIGALRNWSPGVERRLEAGQLAVLRGDVHKPFGGVSAALRHSLRGRVIALLHAAASTRFAATNAGEPHCTNVEGTRHILDLARDLACRDWHLISTAYVAGVTVEAHETCPAAPPPLRNAYEQSKWDAEHLARRAAFDAGAALTVYRPSVVVGHSETGRTTRFVGVYYMFRATSLLARVASQQASIDRHAIALRIPARPDGHPNLICIDDVAHAFGELFDDAAARGGIYHLTHPAPPSNAQIKRVLEACYDIAGGRFETDGAMHAGTTPESSSTFQRLFDEMTAPVRDYLFDAPRFDRTCVRRFVQRPPAPWTDERLRRLIWTAETGGWRASAYERQLAGDVDEIAAYFCAHLPRGIAQSALGRLEALDLAVRFEIGREHGGHWWCRFQGGRLAAAEPANTQPADVVYRTNESRFWAAVAGEITGAQLFLSGEAQIEGDIERALKFAMLLEEFVRAHPYRAHAAQAE